MLASFWGMLVIAQGQVEDKEQLQSPNADNLSTMLIYLQQPVCIGLIGMLQAKMSSIVALGLFSK